MIRVEIIKPSRGALKPFVRLPFDIYKGNPNWVPPLIAAQYKELSQAKGERRFFLVYDNDKPVARVLAGVSERGAKTGYVSLFESYENIDYAKAALDAACKYLKDMGVKRALGPNPPEYSDFSTGMLAEGFDGPPVLFNPYNPAYYPKFFESAGFKKYKDHFAYLLKLDDFQSARVEPLIDRVQKRFGFRVEHITLNNLTRDKYLRDITSIVSRAYPEGWAQGHPSPESIRRELKQMEPFCKPEMMVIAYAGDDPIGIVIGFPDYNQIIRKMGGRLWPLGIFRFLLSRGKIDGARCNMQYVIPEYQNKAVNSVMFYEAISASRRLGIKWVEGSTVDEGNIVTINAIEKAGGRQYRVYRQYEITL